MALYPEVQKKAQAEIDIVVGPNRLPDFHDRPSLSYIDAVVKELTRWNVVTPLGRPYRHCCHRNYPDESRSRSPHVYYRR